MPAPQKPNRSPLRSGGLTPLGIVATFVALSETVAGLAAVKTEGVVQFMFASFAVFFPVFIAGVFFAILWKRAYVLYPPQDFGPEVDVRHYVEAMRHQAVGTQEIHSLVRATIAETLTSPMAQVALSEVTATKLPNAGEALKKASGVIADEAVERLQRSVLTVDIGAFGDLGLVPELVFPFHADDDAFTLLSAVYFQIGDYVQAFTYGKSWALQEEASGKLILPADVNWADNHSLANSGATVAEMGLTAGMRLRAIPLSNATTVRGSAYRNRKGKLGPAPDGAL
jgi:hypothetical protein